MDVHQKCGLSNHTLLNVTCIPQPWSFLWAEMIAACINLPINTFLAVSLIVFRSKLRSQLVSIYARNVVCACAIGSIIRLSDTAWSVNGFAGGPSSYNSLDPSIDRSTLSLSLWLIHKLLIVVIYVVIAGGIAFVIMALRENLFRVHRTVAGVTEEAKDETHLRMNSKFSKFIGEHRRFFAYLTISVSWIVPIGVAIVVSITFNCVFCCSCVYNYIPSNLTLNACSGECSATWPPLPNMVVLFGCFIWLAYVILLIVLLIKSNYDFRRVGRSMIQQQKSVLSQRDQSLGAQVEEDGGPSKIKTSDGDFARDPPRRESKKECDDMPKLGWRARLKGMNRLVMFRHSRKHSSLLLIKLSKHLNTLLIISIVYIVGTGMLVFLIAINILSDDNDLMERHPNFYIPIMVMPGMAECFSAVALCLELPNLRSAVFAMIELVLYVCSCGCWRK